MTKNGNNAIIRTRTCYQCGKKFILAPEHIYKERSHTFCTWGCLVRYRKSFPVKTKKEEPK